MPNNDPKLAKRAQKALICILIGVKVGGFRSQPRSSWLPSGPSATRIPKTVRRCCLSERLERLKSAAAGASRLTNVLVPYSVFWSLRIPHILQTTLQHHDGKYLHFYLCTCTHMYIQMHMYM